MNYYDKILMFVPSLFRRQVTLTILKAAAASIDEAEKARESIQLGLALETAEGVLLDRFGALYQVPRGTYMDARYREVIKAFRLALNSNGEREPIIEAVRLIANADRVVIQEAWPAGIGVTIYGPTIAPHDASLVWLILDRMLGSGISLIGVWHAPNPNGPWFGWSDDPTAETWGLGNWLELLPQ